MNPLRGNFPRVALLSLTLLAAASSAQDLSSAGALALDARAPLLATAQPSWHATSWHALPPSDPPNPFAHLRFRDQQPLVNRLRRLQAVPFVTLWDSRAATLYVGVNRDGETGLHLRQKRDDRGTQARKALMRASDVTTRPRPPRRGPRAIGR